MHKSWPWKENLVAHRQRDWDAFHVGHLYKVGDTNHDPWRDVAPRLLLRVVVGLNGPFRE